MEDEDQRDPCPDCGEVHEDLDSIYIANPLAPGDVRPVGISLSEVRHRFKEDGHDPEQFPIGDVMKVARFTEKMLDKVFSARLCGDKDAIRSYRLLVRSLRDWLRSIGCGAAFDLARALYLANRAMYLDHEAAQAEIDVGEGLDPDDPNYKNVS